MSALTDRELLELAAKAAGIVGEYVEDYGSGDYYYPGNRDGILYALEGGGSAVWNPLTDDGDALRLAVKLGMQVDMRDPETRIYAMGAGDVVTEYHANRDALAATRRAIVRAAAALTQGA